MMPNFPFFIPPRYNRKYPNYNNHSTFTNNAYVNSHKPGANINSSAHVSKEPSAHAINASHLSGYRNPNFVTPEKFDNFSSVIKKLPNGSEDSDKDSPFFEIFGIKLYSDDILLIGLLFFLYNEEVEDPFLFISLILLLLS